MLKQLFSFPDPVNETSARLVAAGVVVLSITSIAFSEKWLVALIAYGFIARVLTGPTLSPLGQLVTRVITPLMPVTNKFCPGPPKRFAQGIGALLSTISAIILLATPWTGVGYSVLAVLAFFAFLEAAFGFCLGCKIFALLMRLGIIPEQICQRCNNLSYDWA